MIRLQVLLPLDSISTNQAGQPLRLVVRPNSDQALVQSSTSLSHHTPPKLELFRARNEAGTVEYLLWFLPDMW